jgi:site-specific recombinase XerD
MQIEQFLKSIKGLSDNTRRAYEQTLWQLDSAIKAKEPTADGIQKFLNTFNASTLHRHKAAIKAYWEYRFKGTEWPFNRRSFLAPRQHLPRYVNPKIVYEMVEKAENPDDAMFVRTLFMMGCRIAELMSFENEMVTDAGVAVKVKGGATKLKVFTKDFRDVFLRYAKGKRGRIFPMSYNYYYTLMKRLGKEVGHPELSPHVLRHARAVDLLRKGMKLSDVQQFLGHANINTTAIYLLITGGELAEQLEEVEGNHRAKASVLDEIRELVKSDPSVKAQLRSILSDEGE